MGIYFPIFRPDGTAFLLQGVTDNDSSTNLKYGNYDITSEKINNNKRLSLTGRI